MKKILISALPCFLIFIFGALYSALSVLKYLRFETNLFDLGIYDQLIWLASRGKPLFSSILDYPNFGDHLTPTLLLLALLYWIFDNPLILLVFQAFFACLGAWPIYQIALKKTKDFSFSILIALAYLLFFGVSYALDFDFHPIVLASTLFAFMLWWYETKKFLWFWITFILFLGLQENFSLLSFAFGLTLFFKKDFKNGLMVSLLSIFYFLSSVFFIIPFYHQSSSLYLPTHWQSSGPVEIVKSMFWPKSKLEVMFFSFSSFGFLSLLSPASLLMLAEEFFQRFVGNPSPNRWVLAYQYNILLTPILAYSAIDSFKRLPKKVVLAILIFGVVSSQVVLRPPLWKLFNPDFYNLQKGKQIQEVLNLIPKDATVAATNNLGSHLAHRQNILLLTNCQEDKSLIFEDIKRCFSTVPEYVVADFSGNENDFYPDGQEKIRSYINYLLSNREYVLIIKQNETYLLKKHGSS